MGLLYLNMAISGKNYLDELQQKWNIRPFTVFIPHFPKRKIFL